MTGAAPAAIFLPMLAVVALTAIAFVRMSIARTRGVAEQRRDPAFYRSFIGAPEPDYAVIAVRHYGNLFEVPTIFYAGCLSLFVLNAVTGWSLVWAWGYAVARIAQSVIHMTYNQPAHRGAAFVLGWIFVVALWCRVGLAVVATPGIVGP